MTDHCWVVNASPIITLCKVGQQDLLSTLADQIILPQSVFLEIEAGANEDPARIWLASKPMPIVEVVPSTMIMKWDLGAGETAVLSYAVQNAGWTAVVDDGAARHCAKTFNVPLLGTLGIILRAAKQGHLPAAAPVLRDLLTAGLRLNHRLIRTALAQTTGESWD